jgi:hypothetical protein
MRRLGGRFRAAPLSSAHAGELAQLLSPQPEMMMTAIPVITTELSLLETKLFFRSFERWDRPLDAESSGMRAMRYGSVHHNP